MTKKHKTALDGWQCAELMSCSSTISIGKHMQWLQPGSSRIVADGVITQSTSPSALGALFLSFHSSSPVMPSLRRRILDYIDTPPQ